MHVLGLFASLLIDLSLGMIGGGGSIFMVPVLVYLFGLPPVLATSFSLFIVRCTSAVGGIRSIILKKVTLKTTALFSCSSIATIFVIRKLVVPRIPQNLFLFNGKSVTYSSVTMLVFSLLMVIAGLKMMRNVPIVGKEKADSLLNLHLLLAGTGIGIITGLLGIGGGFLIVPTFVLLLNIPIKKAVGTSLIVIALNAFSGFVGDLTYVRYNWSFLLLLTGIAIIGLFIGSIIQNRLSSANLKNVFGGFVLCIGIFIFFRELLKTILFPS